MPSASNGLLRFASFQFDPDVERLWRDDAPVSLSPKALAVLRYLLEHPQRLVTKRELLAQLWGDVRVCDAVLKTQMHEIRLALGDDPKSPRFIETVPRRGYRSSAASMARS